MLSRSSLGVRLLSSVQSIDISLMMLRVVERHDLLADVGLESIVAVGKGRKSVLNGYKHRLASSQSIDIAQITPATGIIAMKGIRTGIFVLSGCGGCDRS